MWRKTRVIISYLFKILYFCETTAVMTKRECVGFSTRVRWLFDASALALWHDRSDVVLQKLVLLSVYMLNL